MKKILSFLIVFLLIGVLSIASVENVKGYDTNLYTTITLDDGTTLTYRNSTEEVLRLKEFDYPTQELRAAWVSHLVGSMPSYTNETKWKSDYTYLLDVMQEHGLNCIIFHIRTHNNAFYPSEYNPVATWMKYCDFEEFDPLAWSIEETHKRGMEFHAWLNPYRITDSYVYGEYPESNPASDEANLLTGDSGQILDPGLPNVREFLVNTCMEVVENYDVDAIHFDDYFYISGADDSETRAKYNTEGLSIADFRRKQVDIFIEDLHNELTAFNEANNKCVQLGISPSGVWDSGNGVVTYDSEGNAITNGSNTGTSFIHYEGYLYSDTLKWINEEWIDYIMPQMYWGLNLKTASFAALTDWWSKVVKYKDVNLYCGLGIYMAVEGSSGWPSNAENEIEEQLLNAAMYEEIGGISLYSYNYIKDSHETIVQGMNLIKNDYYKKYVPCDVKQAYSDMPTITPVNVKQDSNVLTWDALDGVRGYMVYKVDQGVTPDKNNYDHLYTYTPNVTIEIDDPLKDYYIATVNKANVVSELVKADVTGANVQYVIDMIDSLPAEITIGEKDAVNKILNAYNLLTISEKRQVTNYSVLESAINKIEKLEVFGQKIDAFVSGVNTHIPADRVLPVIENMTWSYADSSDSAIYNIETGERLKNYLKPYYITLNLTLNEDDLSCTKAVKFNVGILTEDKQGLFYRSHTSTIVDDASAVSKDEIGDYTGVSAKYIGWSGVVFEFDNNSLFIAEGSYVELLDVNSEINVSWTSVGAVVNNLSGSSVTFPLNDLFESYSCNHDTAIIISGGVVKNAYEVGNDFTQTVTLENGEVLVLLRYLDICTLEYYSLDQTNWVECSVRIVNYNNLDVNSEDLEAFKAVGINEITSYVKLEDYSTNNQLLITNLIESFTESINACDSIDLINQKVAEFKEEVNKIKTIKEELEETIEEERTKALSELSTLKNSIVLEDYLSDDRDTINSYFETYNEEITNATTVVEIQALLDELKTCIDEVKTIEEVFEESLAFVREALNTYLKQVTTVQSELEALNQRLEDILDELSLDKEGLIANKDGAIEDAKEELLEEFKVLKIEEINAYLDLNNYSETGKASINTLVNEYKIKINESVSTSDINIKVKEYKEKADLIKTLDEEQTAELEQLYGEFNAYKDSIDFELYLESEQTTINNLLDAFEEVLNSELYGIIEKKSFWISFKKEIEEVKTINQKYDEIIPAIRLELTTYYQTFTNVSSELEQLEAALDECILNSSNNKVVLLEYKETFISETKAGLFNVYKQIKINEINNYVDLNKYSNAKKVEVQTLISAYEIIIFNSGLVDDLNSNVVSFKDELDSVKTLNEEYEEAYSKLCEELTSYIATLTTNDDELLVLNNEYELILEEVVVDKEALVSDLTNIISSKKVVLDTALNNFKDYKEAAEKAIEEITNYVSEKDITRLIEIYTNKVNKADTKEEVEGILNEFKVEVEKKNAPVIISCEGCNSFMIIELISILGLVILFRRRYW